MRCVWIHVIEVLKGSVGDCIRLEGERERQI